MIPAPLTAALIRRRQPLLLLPPPASTSLETRGAEEGAWPGWREDLRFFVACYAAGLVFFLVMLS